MKVLVITNYYYPEIGAAANRIKLMSENLHNQGFEVEVLCPLPNYPRGRIFEEYRNKIFKREFINKINVFRYFIFPSNSSNPLLRAISMCSFAFSIWLFAFRVKLIKNKDLVIIQNSPLLVSFSANIIFGCIYNKKTILNVSDLWPLSAHELGVMKKGIFYKVLQKIEKYNYKISSAFICQSNEIINHIMKFNQKPKFLYRNLPKNIFSNSIIPKKKSIVYAGLLGVAQGIFSIVKKVNFKELGVEFHIYGDGSERNQIEDFLISNPKSNIYYHGSISKKELNVLLPDYYASIIPLKASIYGAVPSKIFELISHGIPILFSGDGEGASIIKDNNLGYCSNPGNYESLIKNIDLLTKLDSKSYMQLKEKCISLSKTKFNFENQFELFISFLKQF
jgi:glycosyltransferase involved in cell wall biosynthesis